jgi:hypothetical protein
MEERTSYLNNGYSSCNSFFCVGHSATLLVVGIYGVEWWMNDELERICKEAVVA